MGEEAATTQRTSTTRNTAPDNDTQNDHSDQTHAVCDADLQDTATEKEEDTTKHVTIETGNTGLKLQRTVSLLGAMSITVGNMIGSGIFITPTSVLRNTKSVGLTLIVWVLGGVLSLLGSLTMAELACRVPKHGGVYAYLETGIGAWLAFIYTWTHLLVGAPSGLAVMCLTFARYLVPMFNLCGLPDLPVSLIAVTLIVTLAVTNMISNRLVVKISVVFLFLKCLALVVIIIGGIIVIATGSQPDSELTTGFEGTTDSAAEIASSFYFVMWAYGGWDNINLIVEEVKNPSRNVPLAAIIGVLLVTVIYSFTNVSYLAVMSREQMLAADTVALTWGRAVLGTGAASFFIPLCVMASTSGSANAVIFTAPRLIFAAARDENFPEVFSYLHVHSRIPVPAISIIIALSIVYSSASSIIQLISIVTLSGWFFFFLATVCLLIIRYRQPKDQQVAFKQPLPVILLFMLCCLYLVVVPMVDGVSFNLIYTFVFLMAGLIVFLIFKFTKDRIHCGDGLVTFLQLLLQVGPTAFYTTEADKTL